MADKPKLSRLLDGVQRYSMTPHGPVKGGQWLNEADVLAALSAAHHVNETPKSEHDRADVLTALEGEKPDKWQCPINYPGCKKNCGGYGCGN